ncbi:MAG: hypothetical protein KGK10_00800 [Rhodospirillales bacterium]|nr:hypothetical protein [Rhodospirillales bacterium]
MNNPAEQMAGNDAAKTWIGRDGKPLACREKLKVLEENRAELATALRDAFEDAVIMGVDPAAMRAVLAAMVAGLKSRNEP